MTRPLLSNWPLFFGLTMIMMGNGLQGSLLGIRASLENFDEMATGLIMSCFYLGYIIGSRFSPRFIRDVGHIRVFAALASLAATTILLHGVFVDPWFWALVRMGTGFSYAGLYIVIESWLNDAATNRTRGRMMATYMILSYLGLVAGQLMLNLAAPEHIELFVLSSVLISVALMPISLSKRPAPTIIIPKSIGIRGLYKKSPLGVIGMVTSGMITSMIFAIAPVYGENAGYTIGQISLLMTAFMIGAILAQPPIGWLSDRFDRRKVLTAVLLTLSLICALTYVTGIMTHAGIVPYLAATIIGGFALSIYSLAAAHTNDHLQKDEITTASATLIMINGLGAMCGPLLVTTIMGNFGTQAYFMTISFVALCAFIIAVYRMRVSPAVPPEAQGTYPIMPVTITERLMSSALHEHDNASNAERNAG